MCLAVRLVVAGEVHTSDCDPTYGPPLRVDVRSCTVEAESDGSLIISVQSSATAMTAPFFTQSGGMSWRITPDGKITRL